MKNRKKQNGFSLIELLIVVSIILIISAIAVPRLLNARAAAIEGRAASTMRTLGTTLTNYDIKWNQFPVALANLGGTTCDTNPPTITAACLLDDAIASQLTTGVGQYQFTYATANGVFTLNGDPVASTNAKRHYFLDAANTLHYSDTNPATASDPAL